MANQPEDVMELQKYLRTIARYRNNLPLIIIDGIFGENTKEAVEAFQRNYNLPVTGVVDQKTWESIYNEYLKVARERGEPICIEAFPSSDFVLTPGASGESVYFLQLMLISLGNKFHNIPKVSLNGKYEKDTMDAVKKLQEKSGIEINGETDKFTWDSIARAYNIHSKPIYPAQTK